MKQMKNQIVAMILALAILIPNTAFAVAIQDGRSTKENSGKITLGVEDDQFLDITKPSTEELTSTDTTQTYSISIKDGKELESISVVVNEHLDNSEGTNKTEEITLNEKNITQTGEVIGASVDAWPTDSNEFELTLEGRRFDADFTADISFTLTESNEGTEENTGEDSEGNEDNISEQKITVDIKNNTSLDISGNSSKELTNTQKEQKYPITIKDTSKKIEAINIVVKKSDTDEEVETIKLSKDKTQQTGNVIEASVDTWSTASSSFYLTLKGIKFDVNYAVEVSFSVTSQDTYLGTISETRYTVVTAPQPDKGSAYYAGKEVEFTVKPEDGYRLTGLKLNYGSETTTMTAAGTWKDWTITWDATGTTKIKGKIQNNFTIEPIVEEIPKTYTVTISVGDGLTLKKPGSTITTVQEGDSLAVSVQKKDGYLFEDCVMQSGKSYGSWMYGQSFLTIGGTRMQVTEVDDTISFTLPQIYEDVKLTFSSTYDEMNIPLTMVENARIDIYTDAGSTVTRGGNATFYVSTTDANYLVYRITVKVGDKQATVAPTTGEVRVDDRTYAIDDLGNGIYAVYINDIEAPVTVSATSSSATSTVSRPTLSASSSGNVTITNSASSNVITSGQDVAFYFTPGRNYQVDQITVQIGANSKTVNATADSVTVGGKTYTMSRNDSGKVTLYLTNIKQNVKVSATAYYSYGQQVEQGVIELNLNTRNAMMSGYQDQTFRPENFMTRAEAVSMLYRMCNLSANVNTSTVYADVPWGMWCATEVNIFANAGILDKATYFYPDQYITRAEFVEMIYRLEGMPQLSGQRVYFSDVTNVAANYAIQYAAAQGWVSGYQDGTFKPYNYMARSEVASMICRMTGRTYGSFGVMYRDVPTTYWAYPYIQMVSSYV